MARLRTFIAIDPGKAARERLIALQENLARTGAEVSWVEPENLHLTMLFLGNVDEREVPDICRIVARVAKEMPAFALGLSGTGCFPNARRPRVLWAGVGAGRDGLIDLHDGLEAALLEHGCYRREERDFTPHVTLGRVKGDPIGEGLSQAMLKYADWQASEAMCREVQVMNSELQSSGPRYTVLSRAKLR